MKALILNFRSIKGKKDASKLYVSFTMFDIENKALYQDMFSDVTEIKLPGGEVPNKEDCEKLFPAMADVDFELRQSVNNGRAVFRPVVTEIKNWKFAELRKLV